MKELRQSIANLSAEEAKALLFELARQEENAEWLTARIVRDREYIMRLYKKRIARALQPGEYKADLRAARKALSEGSKLVGLHDSIELMLFYVETAIAMENEYGDMYEAFYMSIESVYRKLVRTLNDNPSGKERCRSRMKRVLETCTAGWGHEEALTDIYEELA